MAAGRRAGTPARTKGREGAAAAAEPPHAQRAALPGDAAGSPAPVPTPTRAVSRRGRQPWRSAREALPARPLRRGAGAELERRGEGVGRDGRRAPPAELTALSYRCRPAQCPGAQRGRGAALIALLPSDPSPAFRYLPLPNATADPGKRLRPGVPAQPRRVPREREGPREEGAAGGQVSALRRRCCRAPAERGPPRSSPGFFLGCKVLLGDCCLISCAPPSALP